MSTSIASKRPEAIKRDYSIWLPLMNHRVVLAVPSQRGLRSLAAGERLAGDSDGGVGFS